MFFDGPQQFSSIKCNCPPGGQSDFQFTYQNAPNTQFSNFKKFPDSKANYNILNLAEKENNGFYTNNDMNRNQSIKTNYTYGLEKCNIFKNEFPEEPKQSSIKITQMPGGNYCNNEYRQGSIKVTQMPGGNYCNNEYKQGSIKVTQMPGGNYCNTEYRQGSIKVTQMPGGNSKVCYASQ